MLSFLTTPKGPDTSTSAPVVLSLSGTKIHFETPAYNYQKIEQSQSDKPKNDYNLYDFDKYRSVLMREFDESPYDPSTDIAGFACYKNTWSFDKPLLGNKFDAGTLNLTVGVKHINRFGSLFVPSHMEKAVLETLELTFGPRSYWAGENKGGRKFRCPLNWRIVDINGLKGINLFVEDLRTNGGGELTWFFPLTDEHFLSFRFKDTGYPSEKLAVAFKSLTESILSSLKIEYSEDAKQQQENAKADSELSSYSSSIEAFKWDEYEQTPEKFELDS